MNTTRKIYRVSIFDTQADGSSVGLAVWDRFATSADDARVAALDAARREYPTADVEAWVNWEIPERAGRYAAKFVNDSAADPTDAELIRVLGNCSRPPKKEELAAIRAAVFAWRNETGLTSRIEYSVAAL